MPLAALLLVALAAFVYLTSPRLRQMLKDGGARWIFRGLAATAAILVLSHMGAQWAAGGLALALGLGWRFLPRLLAPSAPPPSARPGPMSRREALDTLGLSSDATDAQIAHEYRRLMKRIHPDRGGSAYLAAQVNEARRVLLGR